MVNSTVLAQAFSSGFIGSFAYFTAVKFGFTGGETKKERDIVLNPFKEKTRIIWYCFVGGAVSTIFQYPEPTFVPIQAFILGATWPSIVSQLLSGRLSGVSKREFDDNFKESKEEKGKRKNLNELRTILKRRRQK